MATSNYLLRRLFPGDRLQSLHAFLRGLPAHEAPPLVRDDDSADYRALLETTLVARCGDAPLETLPTRQAPAATISEVLFGVFAFGFVVRV